MACYILNYKGKKCMEMSIQFDVFRHVQHELERLSIRL